VQNVAGVLSHEHVGANGLKLMSLPQALDAVDPGSAEEDSYGMIDPPVAPSSAIIKVDSTIDVRTLVRRRRRALHGAVPAADAPFSHNMMLA